MIQQIKGRKGVRNHFPARGVASRLVPRLPAPSPRRTSHRDRPRPRENVECPGLFNRSQTGVQMISTGYRTAFICKGGALLISLVFGCATNDSPNWQRYTKQEFPARVNSVTTPLGNVLDAEHQLIYPPWTVRFGEGIPYAYYKCPPNTGCEVIINNLTCDHAQGRSSSCEMRLNTNATCGLTIHEPPEILAIRCPQHVSLQQKLFPTLRQP